MDSEPEVERLLGAIQADVVTLRIDTGHCTDAGLDPVA